MVAELNFNNPTVVAFATYGALVIAKMLSLLLLTSFFRVIKKKYANPEDAKVFGLAKDNDEVKKMAAQDSMVERVRRCVLNDMENIIPFMLLAPLYILTGPAHATALLLFRVFVGSRFVHTFSYLFGLQPFRGVAFVVGLGVNAYMISQVIVKGQF